MSLHCLGLRLAPIAAALVIAGCSKAQDDQPVDTTLPGTPAANAVSDTNSADQVSDNAVSDEGNGAEAGLAPSGAPDTVPTSGPQSDQDWAQITPLPAGTSDDGTCSRPILKAQIRSLDGGFVYQQECRWQVSDDIIQVRVADGQRKEVGPGNSLAVIRNGPYRGYLLLQRHKYLPQGGSYDATYVVRPDGSEALKVPNSDGGDASVVQQWLSEQGWGAS
jgi:hypothetical protein